MDNHLERSRIDEILEAMTARDIFAAMPSGQEPGEVKGAEIAAQAFEHAAERQGHGSLALDRVRPSDATYLAAKLGEIFSEGPKDESTDPLPNSSGTGESVPSS